MPRFHGNALVLSGLLGTKLKSDVLGQYYNFWWRITSGGANKNFRYITSIIELNAGTGEVYIEDINTTILGSAGHALDLKMKNVPDTRNLKIVLIENHDESYTNLKKVIGQRWPKIDLNEIEGSFYDNQLKIYLLKTRLEDAVKRIQVLYLGNSIFFFDPLRSVEWKHIETIANNRIRGFYETGTEFLIFLFTSDWFLGRDDFTSLPASHQEHTWTAEERRSVLEADSLFGDKLWREEILNENPIETKQEKFVEFYRDRLQKWFRYILPLPFNPKDNQLFHLILCSNYEIGVRMTKNEYAQRTQNPKYAPNNSKAYEKFKEIHPKIFRNLRGNQRPKEWRILWATIAQHEEGLCDWMCKDFSRIELDSIRVKQVLEWLETTGYLTELRVENAWDVDIKTYKLDWETVQNKLGVKPPHPLKALSPKEIT